MDDDATPPDAAHPPAPPDGALDAELRVRLRLDLGEVEIKLAALAALAPGAVLKVELAGDAPRVAVTANGARIAAGRLVSLGDAYGVLVDEVSPATTGAAPATPAGTSPA